MHFCPHVRAWAGSLCVLAQAPVVFVTSSILSCLLQASQLCKREVGGTTEDALHELLRPAVIEELSSPGVLLSSFFFLSLPSEYAGRLTIDMRIGHCS